MKTDARTTNRALVRFVLLPTVFLTTALLGGVRVVGATGRVEFVPPPLVTLLLAVMLLALFARARLVEFGRWLSEGNPPLVNLSHALTLLALFFASAQSFNSVLPEAGLLRWMLSFFFLWTLWNNQFSSFDPRRLLRSLAALFATAFVIKHLLLASLYSPDAGWLKRLATALLEGATLGTLDGQPHAPATGYVSFFALALYVGGLLLLPSSPGAEETRDRSSLVVGLYERLDAAEKRAVHAAILEEATVSLPPAATTTTDAEDEKRGRSPS